jgi:hypothetical protein
MPDSALLQHTTLVVRATAPPEAAISVLDDGGREVGRVLSEAPKPSRLVLYDAEHTRLLTLKPWRRDEETYEYLDGHGHPIDKRLVSLNQQGGFIRKRPVMMIRDSTKAELGSLAQALPPAGDHRNGVTLLFAITADAAPELRRVALAHAIELAAHLASRSAWIVKQFAKTGVPWPGSATTVESR